MISQTTRGKTLTFLISVDTSDMSLEMLPSGKTLVAAVNLTHVSTRVLQKAMRK